VRWGLVPRGKGRGENERSLEKKGEIEEVEEGGLEGRMRVWLKVGQKGGKPWFKEGKKKGLQESSPKKLGGNNGRGLLNKVP